MIVRIVYIESTDTSFELIPSGSPVVAGTFGSASTSHAALFPQSERRPGAASHVNV
jgi:hypothetical protein